MDNKIQDNKPKELINQSTQNEPTRYIRPASKSTICKFFIKFSICKFEYIYGHVCPYAHSIEELSEAVRLRHI